MSRFEFEDIFDYINNVRYFVVNKKYSLEQAKKIFEREVPSSFKEIIRIEDCYIRYGYGTNEDGEKELNWWLESIKIRNSVPVWVIVYC